MHPPPDFAGHDRSESIQPFQILQGRSLPGLAESIESLRRACYETDPRQAAILVVDDSQQIREMTLLMMRTLGYQNLAEASDGVEALRLLRQLKFDLMILDLNMPKLDGFGVLELLQKDAHLRHLPVIVASGLDELKAVVRSIELGAEDFLPKPANVVLLKARLGASLERKRLRDLEQLRLLELEQEKQRLHHEREKSERLLLNILPGPIADRLKRGEHTIAERHEAVTVLFADLVGFSEFANRTDAQELVGLLNALFSRYDAIADRLGLEKIKTIGDAYLVAGGLPEPRPDHATAVARMALEMLDELAALNREHDTQLAMRIGINSGPVVAGVIGSRKFTYDVWGQTVNLASRMQSAGLHNRINVSASTRDLLVLAGFQFTERGKVSCKGIGEVSAFLLEDAADARGTRNEPPLAAAS